MTATVLQQTSKQDPALILEVYDAADDSADVLVIRKADGTVLASLKDLGSIGLGGPIITKNAGTPESAVTAPIGSLCLDTTNGVAYMKKTGTGNTGWKLVTQAA